MAAAAASSSLPCSEVLDAAEAASFREEPSQRLDFKLKKFKLGYEFQEISGLCPWALQDYRVQKKSLFSLRTKDGIQKLWDLVLDTSDIEFVTVPFANHEKELLEECMNSVLLSLNALQVLFGSHSQVGFSDWTSELEQLLLSSPYGVFYNAAHYPLVNKEGRNLICPFASWRPKFSPQATIQHRLECTIPLYFSLFGFTSRDMPFFSDAFPLRDRFLKVLKAADSLEFEKFLSGEQQKVNGLIFLHALTLVRMAADTDNNARSARDEPRGISSKNAH